MLMYREWSVEKSIEQRKWNSQPWKFNGWFLFGVIPLYIRRFG